MSGAASISALMFFRVNSQHCIDQVLVFRTLRPEPLKDIGVDAHHDRNLSFWKTQSGISKEGIIQRRNVGSINLLLR
jgi:hypothetical protein